MSAETSRIILALDELDFSQCLDLVSMVGDRVYAVKIHSLVDKYGQEIIHELRFFGAQRVWVDAKLHDTPNTVKLRAKAITTESGADIISVHASGGIEMMKAAVEAGPAEIYAITALTSLSEKKVRELFGRSSKRIAVYLAGLAKFAGVHGVVCSPKEVRVLAKRPELQGMKFITPGVRSIGEAVHDQRRVCTPAEAIASGSTHIVVGRQITQAKDPVEALQQIEEEIYQTTTTGAST